MNTSTLHRTTAAPPFRDTGENCEAEDGGFEILRHQGRTPSRPIHRSCGRAAPTGGPLAWPRSFSPFIPPLIGLQHQSFVHTHPPLQHRTHHRKSSSPVSPSEYSTCSAERRTRSMNWQNNRWVFAIFDVGWLLASKLTPNRSTLSMSLRRGDHAPAPCGQALIDTLLESNNVSLHPFQQPLSPSQGPPTKLLIDPPRHRHLGIYSGEPRQPLSAVYRTHQLLLFNFGVTSC